MLRVYGPTCRGETIDPNHQDIPSEATWIDLEEPTKEEERLVELAIGVNVPTPEEMAEIEPSSRLYEESSAVYMTMSTLVGVSEGNPSATPISFVLAGNQLVTIRYATPKPLFNFSEHARRDPALVSDGMATLIHLLDAIIDRLADELEDGAAELEKISQQIFARTSNGPGAKRIPAERLRALLNRIGRAQSLLARIRETALSTNRVVAFLSLSAPARKSEHRERIQSLAADIASLIDHSGFLTNNLTFLLDASLGLINVEQNAIIKIFSVAAVIFLPPTLVGTIYGMNFEHMPELGWLLGYPFAIALMILSAILPYWFFRHRGWL